MAIAPPSSGDAQSETFAREVDVNLRRDRMRDAARTYGKWVIAAVVLLLAAIAGFLLWRDYQAKQAAKDGEALSLALDDIGAGNVKAVPGKLAPLKEANSDAIAVSARLTEAALAVQDNDRSKALGIYREIAADDGLGQPWRDLALVRQTALEYDALEPKVVIDRLAPLTKPGTPWFGSAGEMTALAMMKAGRRSEAGRLFGQIAADKTVPESIRGRAVQIAGSLGVDASAALPS